MRCNRLSSPFALPIAEISCADSSGYIVKGMINRGDICVGYGPSGTGKTFFMLSMAHAIATGTARLFGLRVRKNNVLYLALEGVGAFGKRCKGLLRERGPAPGLFIRQQPTGLFQDESGEMLHSLIAFIKENDIGLVIGDTLARLMTGGKENDATDMGVVINKLATIIAQTNVAFFIVHHPGKNPTLGPRGSSALPAAVDFSLEFGVDLTGNKIAKVVKARDARSDGAYRYTLPEVDLGEDDEGDRDTTCVAEIDAEPRVEKPDDGLKPDERKWFRAIAETIAKLDPEPSRQEGAKHSVAAVPRSSLGDMQFLLLREGSATVGDMRATLSKTERRKAQRIYERLKSKGKIGTNLTHVWVWRQTATDCNT